MMRVPEQLAQCYEAAHEEVIRYQRNEPIDVLEARISGNQYEERSLIGAILAESGVAVIAEHKRRSPSEGAIRVVSNIGRIAGEYQRGGAAAISVLTQARDFGGSPQDLSAARAAVDLPILRKDFIDDEYQLYQAKAYGADAVLLIAAGLEDNRLRGLQGEASDIGLECLVEVHDEQELSRALEVSPKLLGINNRDLSDMSEDRATVSRLIDLVPEGIPVVAASAYSVKKPGHFFELEELGKRGVEAVLMGTVLMRSDDPATELADWLNLSGL